MNSRWNFHMSLTPTQAGRTHRLIKSILQLIFNPRTSGADSAITIMVTKLTFNPRRRGAYTGSTRT